MTAPEPAYRYRAYAEAVHDGDTFRCRLDLGLGVAITVPIRIRGIDAPELSGATREIGRLSRGYLVALLAPSSEYPQPTQLIVQTYKDQRSFERWIADVWIRDTGQSVADHMVSIGQAQPFKP